MCEVGLVIHAASRTVGIVSKVDHEEFRSPNLVIESDQAKTRAETEYSASSMSIGWPMVVSLFLALIF